MAKTGNCGELEKKTGESKNNCDKDGSLSSTLIKSSAVHARGTSLFCGEKGGSECNVKVQNGLGVDEEHSTVSVLNVGTVNVVNATDSCLTERCEKSLTNTKVLEIAKEKGLDDRGTACSIGNKYPSKLHEKLAFLEGKVKRISSDIRRTKEMLDMNNSDTSKVILSDIQDKISGIEKAMSHVKSDSDTKMGFLKVNGNDQELNVVDKCQIEQDNVTCSVKGLNSEELEARLFPHHKLLRNRTSTKASSGSSLSNESHVFTLESKVDEKLLSPIDENPIALEFLASLNKGQRKANIGDHHDDLYEPQATDGAACAGGKDSSYISNKNNAAELLLTTDEKLDDFDDQENRHSSLIEQELEDTSIYQLNEIGHKTSTGGWFVSEGEAVLLAHDDGSCSYYDIANCEEKAVYNPPLEVLPNIWRDCWVIRAPGADGCSGRFVVAASAGNTMDSGFCSWDFYSKQVRAFHVDSGTTASRTILGPLPNNIVQRRNFSSNTLVPETRQWWYRPCGPLIISTATSQKVMKAYDIRDGEEIMKWEVQKPVLTMEYSSPLQWRNRGKVVVAEAETISVWDVNTINPQALLSIPSTGQKISALHVSNTEAELGGGVRQRVSSSEAEGNDGVFCTSDYINVLDFRHPSGVGLKISKLGVNVQSVFSRGDSIFLGCTSLRSVGKKQALSQVQQFSLRKQGLYSTYALPESNAHLYHAAITQVWGNSDFVMGVSGLGLFVFDALKDHMQQAVKTDYGKTENVKEVIGPDDLYSPSFDYMGSRALLISRDRPALWRHLS
ncbi:Transducin/WD40 repeat-like superfamily protein [Quillaja saponaria]|uniref:Transducin/WD40 repeat-like superfamily protein n=1 Tax=Quillaja saponaria TaxID=32244 RepID=A0AAD7QE62_QUISA|nr:Transducin/WD40 repeat-like superfamily protein [Quillaja saponaria]